MLAIRAARMSEGLRLHDRPQILVAGDRIADADFTGAQPPLGYRLPASATRPSRSDPARTTRRKPRPVYFEMGAPDKAALDELAAASADRTDRSFAPRPGGCSRTCTTPTVTRCASTCPARGRRRRTGPHGCTTLPPCLDRAARQP